LTAYFDNEEVAQIFVLGLGTRVSVQLPNDFKSRILAEAKKVIAASV
jgi:hypothetical protein